MVRKSFDFSAYLALLHQDSPGMSEAMLTRMVSGTHTPYRWLARAISARCRLVLDVVASTGAMSRQLAAPGRTVVSVDARQVELREGLARGSGPLVAGDARQLPFAGETFDAVTSALGMAVIRPTAQFVGEAARVLKPGGVLAVMAPALFPMNGADMRELALLAARLRARPRLAGALERTEIALALANHRLRVVEDRRERYRYSVRSRLDAELIVHALFLPSTGQARLDDAVDYLSQRSAARGSVEIPLPMRRLVAIK